MFQFHGGVRNYCCSLARSDLSVSLLHIELDCIDLTKQSFFLVSVCVILMEYQYSNTQVTGKLVQSKCPICQSLSVPFVSFFISSRLVLFIWAHILPGCRLVYFSIWRRAHHQEWRQSLLAVIMQIAPIMCRLTRRLAASKTEQEHIFK